MTKLISFSRKEAELTGLAALRKGEEMKYSKDLPRKMYLYFIGYSDGVGAPSFQKFARSIGATLAELESFRKRPCFERAWRECNEIRRDYLIDSALSKRFDSSFTKFLLSEDSEAGSKAEDGGLSVLLEVIE